MEDLKKRLRMLAEHWRSEARKHDSVRLERRLENREGCEEYWLAKTEAERLMRCAYDLMYEVGVD